MSMILKSPYLLAVSVLASLLSFTGIAKASEDSSGLSFVLPSASQSVASQSVAPQSGAPQSGAPQSGASMVHETIASAQSADRPSLPVSVPVANLKRYEEPLPPLKAPEQIVSQKARADEQIVTKPIVTKDNIDDIGVSFTESAIASSPDQTPPAQPKNLETLGLEDRIFEGGPNSLVAHAVGSAEGTRHWNGQRTKAYYGHVDPGNGVWNMGTFSYQHGAATPEEADEKQLRRLKKQGLQLEHQASRLGIKLSLEEKLNGIDLANQAPLAALGEGGYIERLNQAYRLSLQGPAAISWARTRAYIDPETKAWNAPGLGNSLYSISQDQERRMSAISKALQAYVSHKATGQALAAKLDRITLANLGSEPKPAPPIALDWDIYFIETTLAATSDIAGSPSKNLVSTESFATPEQIMLLREHSTSATKDRPSQTHSATSSALSDQASATQVAAAPVDEFTTEALLTDDTDLAAAQNP